MYKLITSFIYAELIAHESKFKFMQIAVKAATIASNLESMFEDIGLHWGINKCAAVHVKKGKIVPNEGLPLHSGNQIPVLGEGDYYKFLGKYENATQLEKVVMQVRNTSEDYPLYGRHHYHSRKVKATNSFATSVLLYHMWTADWPIEHLRELKWSTLYKTTKIKLTLRSALTHTSN